MENMYKSPEASLDVAGSIENNSGGGKDIIVPDEVKGWSWGAFLLTWIWGIGNKTWFSLLTFIPYVGFIFAIILGFKGREMAWRNKRWDSVEHFQEVQKKWSFWGVLIVGGFLILGIGAAILIPALTETASSTGNL